MLPVLRAIAGGTEHSLPEIRESVALDLKLSEQDLAERLPSGSQPVFANRIAWAVQYLKAARAIEPVARGTYRITDRGCGLLNENLIRIDVDTLRQFPEFAEFARTGSPKNGDSEPVESNCGLETPEESLDRSVELQREALIAELLEAIHNSTPAAFEKLVVQLLVAMGYGGSNGDGRVVGKPGDGGIDGVIQQDKLGLDSVYVQAKKWTGSVGVQEIMQFSGGLTKQHASRGVVITSSTFSTSAQDYVRSLPQRIVLINGKQLASLMIDHNVGVAPNKTYTLKRLDQAYFENL